MNSVLNTHDTLMYLAFLDLEKAFDRVARKTLWNALDEYEIPSEQKRPTTSAYGTCQSKVRVGSGEGEWFDTKLGPLYLESDQKGSIPSLFTMYTDLVIREVATTQEDHNYILKKSKGSFYIAQYPVRWTAQRALHFLLLGPYCTNSSILGRKC